MKSIKPTEMKASYLVFHFVESPSGTLKELRESWLKQSFFDITVV